MVKLKRVQAYIEKCSVLKIQRQLRAPRIIFTIILCAIFGLTAFQIPYQSSILLQAAVPSIAQTEVLYQQTIETFASTYTVAEGKIFVSDDYNLNCFNAQTGKKLWQSNAGGRSGRIVVQDGIVFAGSAGGKVITIDANNGKLLQLQFQAIVETSGGSKSPPTTFAVADGRLYVEQTGWRAYNTSSGALLWESFSPSSTNPPNIPYNDNVRVFEDSLVLASGIYPSDNTFLRGVYRIDPDTGTVLWSIPDFVSYQPLVYKDKIIFLEHNETNPDTEQTVLSVDATTGDIFWSNKLETIIGQPVIHQDQLLFATTNGYFCALNLAGGKLVWKTPLTPPPPFAAEAATPIQVDSQTQRIFWGYISTHYNESIDCYQYEGKLYNIGVTEGNVIWTSLFNANITSVAINLPWQTEIALLNNTVYLKAAIGIDLWALNKTTGTILGMEHYEHYIAPMVSAYNKLFVVADLYVMAYNDYSDNAITEPHSLTKMDKQIIIIATTTAGTIITLSIVVYQKYRKKHNYQKNVEGQSLKIIKP
ncbi:MAG: PQQ-binding-like beta-propeller repeat protein [Nitrososphaerota archaeon]|jgi:outer membrane protein assembly factor BamB|nr:PQQ-binding-like beta-propeller repeat protein [Nitrososphaerota archaeon]